MKPFTKVVITAVLATPWVWNAVKMVSCDFKAPYQCEIAHGIGVVVPPAAWVTVWFDDDELARRNLWTQPHR